MTAGYRPADAEPDHDGEGAEADETGEAATFGPYPGCGSEIGRLLGLMEFLGYPSQGSELSGVA